MCVFWKENRKKSLKRGNFVVLLYRKTLCFAFVGLGHIRYSRLLYFHGRQLLLESDQNGQAVDHIFWIDSLSAMQGVVHPLYDVRSLRLFQWSTLNRYILFYYVPSWLYISNCKLQSPQYTLPENKKLVVFSDMVTLLLVFSVHFSGFSVLLQMPTVQQFSPLFKTVISGIKKARNIAESGFCIFYWY